MLRLVSIIIPCFNGALNSFRKQLRAHLHRDIRE